MTRLFIPFLLILCALAPRAYAAEALLNPIPLPGGSIMLGSEADAGYGNYAANNFHWNPGFRTASSTTHTYVVGSAYDVFNNWPNPLPDGFITKLDPKGNVVRSWKFREVSQIYTRSWRIHDIAVHGDTLYVCGDTHDSLGFVAKLRDLGTTMVLDDYTLIAGKTGPVVTSAYAKANTISVSLVNNEPSIVVAGEILGATMEVQQRQITSPSTGFENLVLRCDWGEQVYTDAYVLRLDSQLNTKWGTTLGHQWSADSASAVTADNTGAIFLALKLEDPDRKGNSVMGDLDNFRRVVTDTNQDGVLVPVGGTWYDYDYQGEYSSQSLLVRLDPHFADDDATGNAIKSLVTSYFSPCKLEGLEKGSHSRVVDLAYDGGKLYAAGDWKKILRPVAHHQEAASGHDVPWSLTNIGAHSSDAWVAIIHPTTLNHEKWRLFQSTGDDYINELTVTADAVYVAGSAGSTLSHRNTLTRNGTGTAFTPNSSAAHLFWTKLGLTDLSVSWHEIPHEGTGVSIPGLQRISGIGVLGDTVMPVGAWDNGPITLGDSGNRKTLPDPPRQAGFAGFMTTAGAWKEGLTVDIKSEFGNPQPGRGKISIISGETIEASVDAIVYEDAEGNVLSSEDTATINERAVTRRICTGYQFKNSNVNGTINSVSFVVSQDTELTFSWRTEHAIEIASDLDGLDGLSSDAAGNPTPEVKKHWYPENDSFTASIDGTAASAALTGTRWRSLGYAAYGSIASAAGVPDGAFVGWLDDHDRQQLDAKVTVGGPGKVVWRWQKEHSLRVAVNSSVANDAPGVWSNRPTPKQVTAPGTDGDRWIFEFAEPVNVTHYLMRRGPQWAANPPDKLWFAYENSSGALQHLAHLDVSALPSGNYVRVTRLGEASIFSKKWVVAGDKAGFFYPTRLDFCEVDAVLYNGGSAPPSLRLKGVGEHWFKEGATVTASAPPHVSSGTSTLALKGYTNGQGAVTPFATQGVSSRVITLNQPSSLTWDYARAIYPETVTIGSALAFSGVTGDDAGRIVKVKPPSGGSIAEGPSGSSWDDMQVWDAVAKKLYPLRPGKFTVEFENTSAPDDAAQNVIIEVTAQWPTEAPYEHIIETPPVGLDTSDTDERAFVSLAYSASRAQVSQSQFAARESGMSTLLFSRRSGGVANGDLERETLDVKVVRSLHWQESAGGSLLPAAIGQAVVDSGHDESAVGHNGHVIHNRAPVNGRIYDRPTRQGSIFPVNERYGIPEGLIAHFPLAEPSGAQTYETVSGDFANFVTTYDPPVAYWSEPGVRFYPDFLEYFQSASSSTGNRITNTLTLAAWINVNGFNEWGGIVTKGTSKAPYALTTTAAGRIRFAANVFAPAGGNGSGTWDSNAVLASNQWVHVAVSYDGVALRFYINGALDSTHNAALTFGSSHEPLTIGADLPGAAEYFDGTIRDVRVYDRSLDANHIAAIREPDLDADKQLAIAWYRVQDDIRWPYKAVNYQPHWPGNTDRIVIASRLGSEGLATAASADSVGSPYVDFHIRPDSPRWRRPNSDLTSLSDDVVPYAAQGFVPNQNDRAWVLSGDFAPWVYLYEDSFDPGAPLKNLVSARSLTIGAENFKNGGGLEAGKLYIMVVSPGTSEDGTGTASVDLDHGTQVYAFQSPLSGPAFSNPEIYTQPDITVMGYNPNEEHALIAPSFLEGTRVAAFALHNDLNQLGARNYTSRPYVLVQYEDRSDPENVIPKMGVYAVEEEDAATRDPRLPEFNQQYTYLYEGTAGLRLVPPHPLDSVLGGAPIPDETEGENVNNRIAYYEDKNAMPWVVSGDTDSEEDIRAAWYYPLRADFWHPSRAFGDPVSFGELTESRPRNIWYNTVWPDDVAVLKAGETLTFSGGEYATDNHTATPRPKGLPQAAAWQSSKLVFDDANESLDAGVMGSNYLARVFPALEAYEVDLALTAVPTELTPASGNVIVDGLLWRFKQLPASLQQRVYYNTSNEKLGVRGLLNGRILGDGDLLAAPGAQTILQPNVLTYEDELLVKDLASSGDWISAVTALAAQSRNPQGASVTGSLGIGLEPGETGAAQPANSFGPGLAVITNPDLQDPGTAGTLPDGYITISENDHEDLGDSPVAMHVIKVTREKYRGSVAVMEPGNVFDEKVSLRHTADFGGDVSELFFQWYLREEDGRDLNPPEIELPDPADRQDSAWTLFKAGKGLSEIQLAGSGPTLITDNLVFCRYGYGDAPTDWSAWAGAANSREPKTATDPPFVAQLVPGWVKRVTEAVNLFDARYDDFRNNDAPATYTSALQQAGQRWEGPVAFNPNKDAIEQVGLIELYQTVLDRAKDFTIASASGTDGVNTALLNAANRIAGLYTLFGNEAYADALDPTIGYSTIGGQFGTLAPAIHAFQNQTANLLDEELMLLRGRSEVGARPAYNRLMWNFTNGPGEAAYVLNYGISDLTKDGFLDDADGRRLYPQGHGDAWGHYTMALKGYYDLATTENFTWSPRNEKVNIDGVVVNVDYLDERAFAKTAAARARCGAELVDLTYRQAYTENPSGQWQGYQDTNTDRAWGVFETAQRSATAAQYDWMLANAILPAEDSTHTGIRKVDRSTVVELSEIAQQAANIQAKLDMADRGLNPAGLDPNVVPFDIDPVLVDRSHEDAATHFEQVYDRAMTAAQNALRSFSQANAVALALRQTESTSETLRQQAIDQDLAYRNELIELFGSPYEGMIGAGKAYPAGYKGPDLYLFMYVDQLSAGGDILDPLDSTIVETTIVPGLRNLAASTGIHAVAADTVSKYFPNDLELPNEPAGEITLNLPRQASGYALIAPEGWEQRRSPGAIQAAVQELVHAQWRTRMAVDAYESQADDFQALLRKFELKSGINSEKIRVAYYTEDRQDLWNTVATTAFAAAGAADLAADITDDTFDVLQEALPKIAGLSNDVTAPARGAIGAIKANLSNIFSGISLAAQVTQYRAELEANEAAVELEKALIAEDAKAELVDILDEMWQLVNAEGDAAAAVVDALETMRAASDRVRTVLEQGQAVLEERRVFNTRVASTTTKQRYEDYTFRVFHHEALRKYRSSFDLASRYAYLAGKAYQYELNLPDNHAANAQPLLSAMLRTRLLGEWQDDEPVLGNGGLADALSVLKTNFGTLKGQLGFNNADTEVQSFSLRRELARIGMSSRVNADWRTRLEAWRVPDLWNYEYQSNGVNYGYIFRHFCRPFAAEASGAQPALVIPFNSTIAAGQNWFGKTLAGGDSAFNASSFSTKIRAAGIRFDGYNNTALSQTPQVYLVPVGDDKMFLPDSRSLASRSWKVVDQRIPTPIAISPDNLANPDWQPFTGSATGFFEGIRKFSSFRAYHDAGGWSSSEMLQSGRLVGRSVWNTQWVLIIPNASLLSDPNNPSAGLDTMIHGAPLPGFDQQTAGLINRDGVGVRDIQLLLQTYKVSGN